MAGRKTGFQYYSIETDRYQDIRIKRLKKEFKCDGLAVYDYILCEIYRVKGCFLEWDESTVFDVADYFGLKENLVKEIVNYCCAVGLFSKELLTNERVLTSQSIQSRFIDWSKKAKRANIEIPEGLMILPEDRVKLPEELQKQLEETQQSKVKKSKEEESKEKKLSAPSEIPDALQTEKAKGYTPGAENKPPQVAPPPSFKGPPIEDVKRFFRGAAGTDEMAEKFWNKWDGVGWIDNGSRIVRWASRANNFITNYHENEKRNGQHSTASGNKSSHGQSTGAIKLAHSLAADCGIVSKGREGNSVD